MLAYILAFVVLAVAALLAFGLPTLMHLQGGLYLGFVILVMVLGIAAAVIIIVLHYRAKKEKEKEQQGELPGTAATAELDLMLNDANRKLRTSQQGAKTLEALPLVYILGDSGTAKTTTVLRSGLDPELLAGTAPHEGDQVQTEVLNLWFTRIAALLEVGAAVRQNNTLLARLVHRTRARAYRSAFGTGAAPRAVVVCLSTEQLLAGDGGQSLMASARTTGGQLREISRLLGMPVPVYVIVTKLDRIPHFEPYVRNLSDSEVRQVLGSALPRSEASIGTYADQAARMLAGTIDGLVFKLGEFRVEMLDRENDPAGIPGVYEFPREFGKVRKNLNQYLVELCKPSQLSANPYLRGFFFTGIRARLVERMAGAPAPVEQRPVQQQDAGATQFINLSMGRPVARAAAAPVMSSSRVPQWTFLPRLFPEVILGDRSALSSTTQTAPARLFRRILFGTLAFLLALYLVFLVISFFHNLGIEHRIQRDAHAIPPVDATATSLPSLSDLRALDDLRQTIVQLDDYRQNSAPWTYRFGLYRGDTLDDQARTIYFDRFRPMLLNPTQASWVAYMRTLPDAPATSASGDSAAYSAAYNPLKAYLITTSHPEKSDIKFLTPVAYQYWLGTRQVEDEQKQLAQKQIDFYGTELLRKPPYEIQPEAAVVDHTQIYLSKFLGDTRIYQNMLVDADRAGTQIDFNRQYPDAIKWVRDDHIVRGAFSRTGFDAMQSAIKNPSKYVQGERWVLGDRSSQLPDLATLATSLGSKYESDYLAAWTAFLQSARVAHCTSFSDASAELDALSGPTSPILELFFTISHNTAVPNEAISKIFQPAQAVVDPNATARLAGPGNQPYLQALAALKSAIDLAAPTLAAKPDPAAFQPVTTSIEAAKTAVNPMALNFNVDPDHSRHTETTVKERLLDPINCVADLAPSPNAGANAAGGRICSAITPLLGKFPFATNPNTTAQASLAEVEKVFAPQTGTFWASYPDLKPILVLSGGQYVTAPDAPPKTNPRFVQYFNRAAHLSSVLYSGGQTPSFAFTLRFVPSTGVSNATFVVDNDRIPSGANTHQFTWTGASAQKTSLIYDGNEAYSFTGTWSLFQMVRSAEKITRSAGGYLLNYPITTAISGHTISTGKTVVFEISGPGAELLVGDGFIGLGCAQPVVFK